MKKAITLLLSFTLVLLVAVGCGKSQGGTAKGSVKTGLGILSSIEKSTDATADKAGLAQADSVIAAITVDSDGKIVNCYIDAVQSKMNFSKSGEITTDMKTMFSTKKELGESYGMKKASSIGKEWGEEADAFAKYVVGKTMNEIKGIAVNEKGAPTDSEIASSVTVSVGDFIAVIEKAFNNAKDLGAKANDTLGVGVVTSMAKSSNAGEKEGVAQAYSNYTAVTFSKDSKITSCVIDASQTNINFTKEGKITSDLKAELKTKDELGAGYGMAKASSIGKEWFEQAEAFAKYVSGKTVDEVKNISVNEKDAPNGADLSTSVTISISDFMDIINKAKNNAK